MKREHEVKITSLWIEVDGNRLSVPSDGIGLLKEVYHSQIGDYPKFYKMDILCQLGFITSELLLMAEGKERFVECEDRAVLLFGKHSSICADRDYLHTISDEKNFFPSPSTFVYTLPNIVAGEIALRNKYHGETSYFAVDNPSLMEEHVEVFMQTSPHVQSVICGWIDAVDKTDFEAQMWLIRK